MLQEFDQILYVVDAAQATHFRAVFDLARRQGLLGMHALANRNSTASENAHASHIPFGVVQGSDGRRFRTRDGDTVALQGAVLRLPVLVICHHNGKLDLLETAVSRALATLQARQSSVADLRECAQLVGIGNRTFAAALSQSTTGAVKYFDLRHHRTSDYVFDLDEMLDPKGSVAVCVAPLTW